MVIDWPHACRAPDTSTLSCSPPMADHPRTKRWHAPWQPSQPAVMQSPRLSAQPLATTPNGPSARRHPACQQHVPTSPHKASHPNGSPNSSAKPDGSMSRPDRTVGPADLATAVNQPGALPPDHARSVPPRKPVTRFHHHSGSSETSEIAQRQYTLSLIVIGAGLAFLRLDLDAGLTQPEPH